MAKQILSQQDDTIPITSSFEGGFDVTGAKSDGIYLRLFEKDFNDER
jgi:hypothetical protein